MKIIFMGTPDFAATSLRALLEAGHDICAIYTQPPRKAGRGHKLTPSPVQQCAEKYGVPIHTPLSLKSFEAQEKFRSFQADLVVVAAYGLLLPRAILDAPKIMCVNVHASLLPRWRGAAPIHRAILAGDTETGITLMHMDEGLDTGAMLAMEKISISSLMNVQMLHDALAELGAGMLLELCDKPLPWSETAQPDQGATYAAKIKKEEARLDWTLDANTLHRQIRAFNPFPGPFFIYNNEVFKVRSAEIVKETGTAGTVLDDQLTIACGHEAIRITSLQREGKKSLSAADFLRGFELPKGTHLAL